MSNKVKNYWRSAHEELPPPNEHNPANSVAVIWCDANADDPEYAQHVGRLWYLNPEIKLSYARFDSSGESQYLFSPIDGTARDLYWRYPEALPKAVKR
jgi:hypothetical protein